MPEILGFGARIGRIAFLFMAHLVGTADITLVLASAPAIEDALALSHAGFGLLVSAYFIVQLLLSIPSAWIVDRFGIRQVLVGSHTVIAIGMCLLAEAKGPALATVALMLCGSGYVLVNVTTTRAVVAWFPLRIRGTTLGIKQTGVPVGGVIGALAVAAGLTDWRELASYFALITLLVGLSCVVLRGTSRTTNIPPGLLEMRELLRLPRIVRYGIGTCLYGIALGAFLAYIVLFAREIHLVGAATASLCLAIAHATAAFGRVAWGGLSDFLVSNGRVHCLVACGISSAVGVLLLVLAPATIGNVALLILVALLGLTLGSYAVLTHMAFIEAVDPRFASAAIGYTMLSTTSGLTLGPALFGAMLEWVGYTPAWMVTIALLLLGTAMFYTGEKPRRAQFERVRTHLKR